MHSETTSALTLCVTSCRSQVRQPIDGQEKSQRGGNLGDAREVRAIKRSAPSDSENGGSDDAYEDDNSVEQLLDSTERREEQEAAAQQQQRGREAGWKRKQRSSRLAAAPGRHTMDSFFKGGAAAASPRRVAEEAKASRHGPKEAVLPPCGPRPRGSLPALSPKARYRARPSAAFRRPPNVAWSLRHAWT